MRIDNYSREQLIELYKMMVLIRYCEESLVEPILNNEIRCPCHLYTGQEAIAAGICASLTAEDYVFGTHRSHGHFLAKGGDLNELISEIYGRESGCSRGRGGSMHLVDPANGFLGAAPIVGGTIPLGVGAALASLIRGEKRVTVCFFGDGACGEGVLYESLNFSSLRKLPIIFVCENNLYSTHLSINECRLDTNISRIAEPFCIPNSRIDGNDVLEVYKTGKKFVEFCRSGRGPAFIECLTYRYRGHVGPDDNIQGEHTDIRPACEIREWLDKDPISRLESSILETGSATQDQIESIKKAIENQILDAHERAKVSPFPSSEHLVKYVYSSNTMIDI
ncbi:MAG: thiamine pyrophosphate-dependent dehydrogenase E1 component subunit alpha [Candidatus Omnitrophota bacterium]